MKLYYTPGASSLAPHIIAIETGIPLDLVAVDLGSKQTPDGADFHGVNPNGYIPALICDDGRLMTEVPVVLQYLAEASGKSGLLPAVGTDARYDVLRWLTFVGMELHKNFSVLFSPFSHAEAEAMAREILAQRLAHLDRGLEGREYLVGDDFSIADAYAWVALSWAAVVGVDLSPFANLQRYRDTHAARPAVQQALREEGLA